MKKGLITVLAAVCVNLSAQPSMDPSAAYKAADEILGKMSIEEKAQIVRGFDKFWIRGFDKYGIKPVYMSDASMGVNLRNNHPSPGLVDQLDSSTAFPATIMLASSFSPELAYSYAKAIGEECRAGGIDILLGPGLNIQRQSQCTRNFEYFGEDPYLVSEMVSNYVKGLQSTGTAACLKHFFGNQTEFYRKRSNSVIGERAMHEIYLPGFKAGIDAGAACVMTSYNQIDGEWAGQSSYVIQDILRQELGFKWMVMTDWNSVWDLEKVIKSGQNIEMPGSYDFGVSVMDLYKAGKISESDLDNMARPVIATSLAMGFYSRPRQDTSLLSKFPEHAALAEQVAAEGIVLLKNERHILPLDPGVNRKILLTGKFVNKIACGYGAAEVSGYGNISMKEALENEFGRTIYYIEKPTVAELEEADAVILSIGTEDRESVERSFSLPAGEKSFANYVTAHNPNTVVVVNSGSAIDMAGWNDRAAAVIYGWYGGQSGYKALADIITGKKNPSGKLPMTIEKSFKDSPAYGYLPKGAQFYNELRNEMMINVYDIHYDESILVGYRWYDTKKIEPLYPFGHGLSYTSFSISKPQQSSRKIEDDGYITISVQIKNEGEMEGAEVVQLYISEEKPSVLRPEKELKHFKKVYLAPGETETVKFNISYEDLAFWDEASHNWKVNPGAYKALIGNSSRNISCTLSFETR